MHSTKVVDDFVNITPSGSQDNDVLYHTSLMN